ncbi:flagellar basal body P-ring formation chaperone FlgA [Thiomicrorhabdus sp.]|uniref:flagellar basal body P-ring formation chaperone FlgA n=1 Tax=Thiomicrorhabdus sp. TaxID=2039724 RepID=UPI0029C9003A|nr:flagellar basal body P-ring formation chaperone FlgA [Thiomicrorhabdus sp.]
MKNVIHSVTLVTIRSLILFLSCSYSGLVSAQEYESVETLSHQASEYIKQKIDQKVYRPKIELRSLSENLQLPKCQNTVDIADRNPDIYAGRMTLSLSCKTPNWRIFIPVRVEGDLKVVVAIQGILKNAVIESQDVAYQYRSYKEVPRSGNVSLQQVIGMRARQNIGAGKILTLNYLSPPLWVRKSQPITLITRFNGIEVKADGTALEDGSEKDTVKVENTTSKKKLKGIVIAPGTVRIP